MDRRVFGAGSAIAGAEEAGQRIVGTGLQGFAENVVFFGAFENGLNGHVGLRVDG
ncbi:hypothetical protein D3C87_2203490 [compost metagenome]